MIKINGIIRRLYDYIPLLGDLRRIRQEVSRLRHDLQAVRTLFVSLLEEQVIAADDRYTEPKRLSRHGIQACSQNGEDGIIEEIFHRVGFQNKVFVEVGVGDGIENNTSFLLSIGWSGFWLDGNAEMMKCITDWDRRSPNCLKGAVAFVTRENAASLLEGMNVPKDPDLLSIDIDQNTFHIWLALSSYRPRVVVVEYNASIPPRIDWKVQYVGDRVWDGTANFGASLKAFESLGRKLGYSLVGCDLAGVNAFFVRDDLLGDLFASPFTAENHYEPPRYALGHRNGHPRGVLDLSQD